MSIAKETRICNKPLEIRANESGGKTLTGYAAVFDSDSEPIMGLFVERIQKGAFSRALAEKQDVRALVDHDSRLIIGRSKSGTLRLSEDDYGLRVEIDVPDTQVGRDLITSVERRDISQMSFGFIAKEDAWKFADQRGGMDVRTLIDVDLFDVSAVAYPAYPETELSARSKTSYEAAKAEHEAATRKKGHSVADAELRIKLAL